MVLRLHSQIFMRQNKWIKLTSGLSFKNLKYGFSIALEIYGCKRESSGLQYIPGSSVQGDFMTGNRSPAHQAPEHRAALPKID